MTLKEDIYEKVETLSVREQQEVLDFAEFLHSKKESNKKQKPFKSLYGLWANRGIEITEEDIDEIRREMWSNFPREDI
jgi:Ulp1 family protease